MCWIIVIIEILSLFIRRVTLRFRLLANIIGGHLIIELGFQWLPKGILFLIFYEYFVRFVQAIIFSILINSYINERLEAY